MTVSVCMCVCVRDGGAGVWFDGTGSFGYVRPFDMAQVSKHSSRYTLCWWVAAIHSADAEMQRLGLDEAFP